MPNVKSLLQKVSETAWVKSMLPLQKIDRYRTKEVVGKGFYALYSWDNGISWNRLGDNGHGEFGLYDESCERHPLKTEQEALDRIKAHKTSLNIKREIKYKEVS